MANNSGICVKMYHVFGDKLWGLEPSVCLQVPIMKPTFAVPSTSLDDFPSLGDGAARSKKESKKECPIETEPNERIATTDSVVGNQIDIINVEENLSDLALGSSSEYPPNISACDNSKDQEDEKLKKMLLKSPSNEWEKTQLYRF